MRATRKRRSTPTRLSKLRLRRHGPLVLLIAVSALTVPAATAGGCSCIGGDPRPALSRADAAFVGTVAAKRALPGREWPSVEYVFVVEKVHKGRLGPTVAVRSADNSASCGLELEKGHRVGLLLSRNGSTWTAGSCALVDPADLDEATRPYPPGSGQGRARLLVAGPFHDAGLAALDARGKLIGWVFGSEGDAVGACPGGRYVVQGGDDLAVIRTRDLRVVERRPLPGDATHAVRCLDRRARDVVAVTFPYGTGSGRQTLVRLHDGELTRLAVERSFGASLGRRQAYFTLARSGRPAALMVVRYRDGERRPLGEAGRYDSVSLSPDERHVAVLEGARRGKLSVIDVRSGRTRERHVDVEWSQPVWLGARRVAVAGPRRRATVFDLGLRRTHILPSWSSSVTAAAARRLWFTSPNGRVGAIRLDAGTKTWTAAPRLPGARALAVLPSGVVVAAASRRAPAVAEAPCGAGSSRRTSCTDERLSRPC